MEKNKNTTSLHNSSVENEIQNDILYLKLSDIGKYVSTLFFNKIGNSEKYKIFNNYNEHYADIKFKYIRFLDNENDKTNPEKVYIIKIERLPDFSGFVNALGFSNLMLRFSNSRHYKIKTIYDIYKVFNIINKQYKIINKKHLSLYDIRDLLEEVILINS